ncbi:MAG: septal ring lytic transglycosylase RlpA family protein [Burkholderiales bacterium]
MMAGRGVRDEGRGIKRVSVLALIIVALLALAGCGGAPSKPGGYYLDDGPGPNPPTDLDAIPEPVPTSEPINPNTSRPYTVLGRRYIPLPQAHPYKQRGVASWYGKRYHGQKTSTGEIYDMYAMSAAHTVLPLPSYARVTNVATGKSVVVRINDRGPFHDERLIDLSYAAAHRIGIIGAGSALVEVETLLPGAAGAAPQSSPATSLDVAEPVPQGGVFVQLGAFTITDNAEAFVERLRREQTWLAASLRVVHGENVHKVQSGPYATRQEAMAIIERARQAGMEAFTIDP